MTTIFVTHDQEEALTLSDTVAILDRGRIVQEGQPADIYERPRTRFAASFLGDANFFTGRVVLGGIEIAGGVVRTSDELPAAGIECHRRGEAREDEDSGSDDCRSPTRTACKPS